MTLQSRRGLLVSVVAFLPAAVAQRAKIAMPTVAGGAVPLYPPLARAANVQGVVHVEVRTDAARVVTATAKAGHRLLAVAAEDNAKTWQFAKHEPTSFTVTYRYRIDPSGDPDNSTVIL